MDKLRNIIGKNQAQGAGGAGAPAKARDLRLKLGVLAVLLLLPILLQNEPYYQEILTFVFLWGAMSGAWNIVGGYAGKFSLGHAAFFGIGAYTSGLLYTKLGISPWLGMFGGMLLSVIFALLIGVVTLRLKGKFFALCTIAFGMLVEIMAVYLRGVTGGSEGLLIPYEPGFWNMTFASKVVWAYIFLALMLGVYGVSRWLDKSALGYRLSALREDEDAAEALGVNTLAGKLSSITISAAITALGGSLFAQYFLWLEPNFCVSLDLSQQFALISIIGGMGTAIGPLVGAAIITPLQIFLRAAFGSAASGMSMMIYGFLLVVVVLYMPKGIVVEVRDRLRARRTKAVAGVVEREVSNVA